MAVDGIWRLTSVCWKCRRQPGQTNFNIQLRTLNSHWVSALSLTASYMFVILREIAWSSSPVWSIVPSFWMQWAHYSKLFLYTKRCHLHHRCHLQGEVTFRCCFSCLKLPECFSEAWTTVFARRLTKLNPLTVLRDIFQLKQWPILTRLATPPLESLRNARGRKIAIREEAS